MNIPLPSGSEAIAHWARQARLSYRSFPQQDWFAAWEPFDTMVSAQAYFNSVSWAEGKATVTIAEPWLAEMGSEPVGRTLMAFASHPGFFRRAAARRGEHFNTRVSFLVNAPPPEVKIGDPIWDREVKTFAASSSEATVAFPKSARQLLMSWHFSGHVEVRAGGLVVNFAGTDPTPEHLSRLRKCVAPLLRSLVAG